MSVHDSKTILFLLISYRFTASLMLRQVMLIFRTTWNSSFFSQIMWSCVLEWRPRLPSPSSLLQLSFTTSLHRCGKKELAFCASFSTTCLPIFFPVFLVLRDLHEQLLRSVMSFKLYFLRSSQVLINLVFVCYVPFYSMVLYSATKWTTLSRS